MALDPDPDTGDIVRYESEYVPTADGTTSGGGLPGSPTTITNGAAGFIPTQPIPVSGGDLVWYYKEIIKNTSGSDDLPAPLFYLRSGVFRPASSGVFSFVSDNVNCAAIVRLTFINVIGSVWDTEEITMNGTTPVISTKSVEADSHVYFEVINDTGLGSSAVLTPADQNIFITRGTPLGFIEKDFVISDSLHQLATDSVVDSTSSTTSRLTIPSSGVEAFGEAFSVDTAVPIVGGLDLLAGEFIGLWYEKTAPEGMPAPLNYFQPRLTIRTYLP